MCEVVLVDEVYNGELNEYEKDAVCTRWIRSVYHWMHRVAAFADVRKFACRKVLRTECPQNDAR